MIKSSHITSHHIMLVVKQKMKTSGNDLTSSFLLSIKAVCILALLGTVAARFPEESIRKVSKQLSE
jgi:hypothetical protein